MLCVASRRRRRRPCVFAEDHDAFSVRTPKTTATLSETAEGRALICAGSKFRTFSFAPEARREVELRERWSYSKKVR